MNNPYPGRWVFGNLGRTSLLQTYFAGQDTRLHTPDLNPVDKLAFRMLPLWRRKPGRAAMRAVRRMLTAVRPAGWSTSEKRYFRGLSRAVDTLDLEGYLVRYFFHCHPETIPSEAHSPEHFRALVDFFRVDFGHVDNQRHLYNEIVRLKWQEQYTHDIRYLQDVARLTGTYMAMPFYDVKLAEFSSSIPFKQATRFVVGRDRYTQKRVLVNKYMLRMAFRGRLNDPVFYRQKAVSRSLYLLCNGVLGKILADLLQRDLTSGDSFVREFHLKPMVDLFLGRQDWTPVHDNYLLKVYILAILGLYRRQARRNAGAGHVRQG
jgi:hypothetical protein